MNAEAARIVADQQAAIAAQPDLDAFRKLALKNLKIKTVIKESHCSPVHQLVFNHMEEDLGNLFATVGKDQATVYDDLHMGDYVGVVVQFNNAPSEFADGGELRTCCWVSAKGVTPHPNGDAYLAVSGSDPNISIISVVEARVITLLKGHRGKVMALAATATRPGEVFSLGEDNTVKRWDVGREECSGSCAVGSDAVSLAVHPDQGVFVTGGKRGGITAYRLDASGDKGERFGTKGTGHNDAIDCLSFLTGNRLASKSVDGRICIWDFCTGAQLQSWRVPGCNGGLRCEFNATPDGAFLVAGNSGGDAFVYETGSGSQAARVSPIKVQGAVLACAIADDCRHVLTAVGHGFIFRHEHVVEGGHGGPRGSQWRPQPDPCRSVQGGGRNGS